MKVDEQKKVVRKLDEEEGVRKGKTERSREIAAKMKRKGLPIEEIMEFTSLSPEEIEAL